MKLTKLASPSPDHAECHKCFGTGFFCLGIENGKPYSNTGFACYPCGGTGYRLSRTTAMAEPLPAIERAAAPKLSLPFKSQADMKRQMQALLDASDRMVEAALVRLLDYQTAAEQDVGATTESNGVGFGAFDANLLTSFAGQLKAGRHLSLKQMEIARKKVRKYWKQLGLLASMKAGINA